MARITRATGPIVALAHCPKCNRVEWMRNAGEFLYQCEECLGTVAKPIDTASKVSDEDYASVWANIDEENG